MSNPTILTIDLNFLEKPGTIGVYLVPHHAGALLIETGPTSTVHNLVYSLGQHGFSPSDITDVFLTHIHLDHAGAAGWWARQGARIHAHPNGIPHLVNPEKLLSSAALVFGKQLDSLWGGFLPVPAAQLNSLKDETRITIGGINIQALDVPGHATHHLAYLIGDVCFTGDIGGIRVHNQRYISLPMPPPDLNINHWRASIRKLMKHHPQVIVPTHFGMYHDAEWHFNAALNLLDDIELWIESTMPRNLSLNILREEYAQYESNRARRAGIDELAAVSQQIANPSTMAAEGIMRYWKKFSSRTPEDIQ
jgi:glyoxylase-like metal-dependent hydrolase (beta-lactamase superfamily II)